MYVATASPRPKRSAFDSSRGGNVPCVPPPLDPPLHIALAGACYEPRLVFNLLEAFAYLCGRFLFVQSIFFFLIHHANTHFMSVALVM